MTPLPSNYEAFFTAATGRSPYQYQLDLTLAERPPDVLAVPTGSGKTQALVCAWLFNRFVQQHAPRRLVYALPMRTLVEQTANVTQELLKRLELSEDVGLHLLMGGEEPTDWREQPHRPQILVGTIDMLLSRALNRGYAESRYGWPVAFGLLNNDCRWVFDEVQLMGPARATSAQLDGLRDKLGTVAPCQTVWASATVDLAALRTIDRDREARVLALPEADRAGALLARLQAKKTLERIDVAGATAERFGRRIAEVLADRHVPDTRTLAVVNTVDRAQAIAEALERLLRHAPQRPDVVLLHSRYRPPDRAARMCEALAPPPAEGTIVVATQVIEAGVDLSARTLVTESAPFSSVVQRLGRCNRAGEYAESDVLWLDAGELSADARGMKAAAPYAVEDLSATRQALLGLVGTSLSPSALEEIAVDEVADEPVVLRRRDLLDLFDTAADLSGMDVDIAPYIRPDDDRSVAVFFREVEVRAPLHDEALPIRDELVSVPIGSLGERWMWLHDHIDGVWLPVFRRDVRPGATVLLAAQQGGYEPRVGWRPNSKAPVEPVSGARTPPAAAALGGDPGSSGDAPVELLTHLQDVQEEVMQLAGMLDLPERLRDALSQAAALHDIGKAHAVFQATLRTSMDGDGGDRLWAKSGRRGGPGHARRHFRHELASALAVRAAAGSLPSADPLIPYLVAAHHGRIRLSIRPGPDEPRPRDAPSDARFALGIVEGEHLPACETPLGHLEETELRLGCMELGAPDSWTDQALDLRDDSGLGPFRLGYAEALLRIADWRASA
jgi:CRISPR-associated endonuclease/helicase Cas3